MENTPESEPVPVSEPIEQVVLRLMRPDLLEEYSKEKKRHKEEMAAIETAMKRARQFIKRFFGKLREQKAAELEAEYVERVQGEADRHDRFMQELRETIRDYRQDESK